MDEGCRNTVIDSFNSILVRLKGSDGLVFDEVQTFQFHSGTVKSVSVVVIDGFVDRFNSILVRLKADACTLNLHYGPMFQFHSGTVKSPNVCRCLFYRHWFQFHSGTVKSGLRGREAAAERVVSIPFWYG